MDGMDGEGGGGREALHHGPVPSFRDFPSMVRGDDE